MELLELLERQHPLESLAAVRKVDDAEDERDRPGEHERDQREMEARDPERRQPDDRPDNGRGEAGDQEHDRVRETRRRTGRACATQAPTASSAIWQSDTIPTRP